MTKMKISLHPWQLLLLGGLAMLMATTAQAQYSFIAVAPCRVVDTRNPSSTNGGPALGPATTRSFAIRGNCGVPTTAVAVSLNVTVTGATSASYLTLWPAGTGQPNVSTINFTQNDVALANGAIVGVSTTRSPDLSVYNGYGSVNVILDINGYFQ